MIFPLALSTCVPVNDFSEAQFLRGGVARLSIPILVERGPASSIMPPKRKQPATNGSRKSKAKAECDDAPGFIHIVRWHRVHDFQLHS